MVASPPPAAEGAGVTPPAEEHAVGLSGRQEHILSVARDVFAERGLKQSTVREIGTRAGVLSGSLYYHFPSKLDIVDAILQSFCTEVLDEYQRIAASCPDAVDRLQAMARYAFSLIEHHAASVLILQNDSADLVGDPRFAYLVDFNEDVERHWVDALRDGIAHGRIRGDIDTGLYYRFARDAILGATAWYDPSSRHTLESVADAFGEMLVRGITSATTRAAELQRIGDR
jgi:AcrR family transcriptional regulator